MPVVSTVTSSTLAAQRYQRIREALGGGRTGREPSDADLQAALGELERLEPTQLEWALSRLHVEGLLETLFGQVSGPRRMELLELCRVKGILQREGGHPIEGSCEPFEAASALCQALFGRALRSA